MFKKHSRFLKVQKSFQEFRIYIKAFKIFCGPKSFQDFLWFKLFKVWKQLWLFFNFEFQQLESHCSQIIHFIYKKFNHQSFQNNLNNLFHFTPTITTLSDKFICNLCFQLCLQHLSLVIKIIFTVIASDVAFCNFLFPSSLAFFVCLPAIL